MPPIRSARSRKPPPDGFDDLEDTLLEFSNKMKDAENASHEGKKRHEVLWPIFQITHQRAYGPPAWVLFPSFGISVCLLTEDHHQDQDTFMIFTMRKRLSRRLCTTGSWRMGTRTQTWSRNGRNRGMRRYAPKIAWLQNIPSTNTFLFLTVMLSPLHPDQRDEFQRYLHMSSAKGAAKGGPDNWMCRLRMPWLCF